jgi:hypothetical protein
MSDDADQTEQLREIVGDVLSPDLRDQFVEYARLDAFQGEDGELDKEKVMGHLTAISVATQPNWGQGTGQPPGRQPGDDARAALRKRHGVGADTVQPGAASQIQRGQNGREALERRHGKKR